MSREIINIQAGQAGNQVGEAFWGMLLAEHGLDQSGMYQGSNPQEIERVGTYFTEVGSKEQPKYVPRSVQIDLEAGVTNRIRSGPMGGLFRPDTYITGENGAGNNWAKGFYTEGAEIAESIIDVVSRQAEACDSLQGFQLLHSLGGGTGAGLGTLMLSKLREEYPDRMLSTFSVMPSPKVSETVVEPYNALLSLHQLIATSDMTICLDNEALYDIAVRTLKTQSPAFSDLNNIIAKVMCGVSTSLRFPGQLNGDLRKLGMNLIPFPRLHFLMPSYAPIVHPGSQSFQKVSVFELISAMFDRKNLLVATDPRFGLRYIVFQDALCITITDGTSQRGVMEFQKKNAHQFVEWIPDNVSLSLCSVPPVGQVQAGTALANSTCMQELFKRTLTQFSAMYKRRAFLHWYTQEGLDELEMGEAEANAQDLVHEYQQYQEATTESEEDGEAEIEYYDESQLPEPSLIDQSDAGFD
ncbi:tubulin-domain-containing protein [Athelia psychrophila]|uniref:Tubulin beta chain n=1 Tax=Athelia psychrophila TaxID=1759441 RepID=A0A166L820_9AGAM|nr:tubulin-domain-containing protein [Fibularhizoctonia sp. CBS 109695]